MKMENSQEILISKARAGDRAAFSQLIDDSATKLRSIIKRMVGHPEDTEELFQDSLLKAWKSMQHFRGDAQFSTWLCAIGARTALDFLRAQKTWRARAQIAYGNECANDPELGAEVQASLANPDRVFDVHEHIAYCFACVGRSLPAEQQAALVLREVLELSAKEASEALGLTQSVFKHHLSAARKHMSEVFDDLCSLVNKQGVCYQCKGLSMAAAETRNTQVQRLDNFEERVAIVRGVEPLQGVGKLMHDLFWQRTAQLEAEGRGSCEAETDCGRCN